MKRSTFSRFLPVVLLCLLAVTPLRAQQTISSIEVRGIGLIPVNQDAVLVHVQQKPGDPFNQDKVNQDVRRLEATGRYAFVGVNAERAEDGVRLVYSVAERARLSSLRIEGARYYSNLRVREILELRVHDRVDDRIVQERIDKLLQRYRKAYWVGTKVDYTLEAPDAAGFASLRIVIQEGQKQRIRTIRFTGNDEFTGPDLRRVMRSKEQTLFGGGVYDPFVLQQDLGAIADRFRSRGYLDVQVGPPETHEGEKGRLHIVIPIQKNQRYFVNAIRIEGAALFPVSLLGSQVPLGVGDVARSTSMDLGRRNLRDFYSNRGYARTQVILKQELTGRPNWVDLVYVIQEGRLSYVRDVEIRGNRVTRDRVIRRELSVHPGDKVNEVEMRNSVRRLRNLKYFSYVNATLLPTDQPDVYDIGIDVEETGTGQFVAGVGFSSIDDLTGFLEISQGNFSLWPFGAGGGDKIKLRLQAGTERQDAELRYTHPWLFDQRLTLTVRAFYEEKRFLSDDYDQENQGFGVGLSRALSEHWRTALEYTIEEINVFDVSEDASELISREEGRNLRSGIDLSFTRDSRNDPFIPSNGGRVHLSTGVTGGVLGGDVDIHNTEVRISYFFPLWWDHVLNLQARAQSVDYYGDSDHVPVFDRYFMGGATTVRAFNFRDVGPKDDNGDPVGGQSAAFASAEYTIPLNRVIRLAAFYDWGVVNEDAMDFDTTAANSSYGVGLRLDFPGFPLRFDYSWPIDADSFNDRDSGRFSFFIGYGY